MTTCEMCGTEKGPFYNAKVEGTDMRVCQNCKRYATEARQVREQPPQKKKKKQKTPDPEPEQDEKGELIQIIAPDYARRIKKAREKHGLKQEELGKRIAEKTSLLHAVESGKHEPRMELARKLERALGIQLVVQHEEKKPKGQEKKRSGPLTIGDLIKNR